MAFSLFFAPPARFPIRGATGIVIDAPPPVSIHPPPPTSSVGPPKHQENSGPFRLEPPTKGKLVNLFDKVEYTFMFNPTEVQFGEAWDWSKAKVAGMSHVVHAGGAGGDRPITFTLYLDADRGRMQNRQRTASPGEKADSQKLPADNAASMDLTAEINQYRSLTYPVQDPSALTTAGRSTPPKVSLELGPLFPRVVCIVERIDATVMAFNKDMSPKRAQLAMTLARWSNKSRNYKNFADPSNGDV